MPALQASFWILTIPHKDFLPYLPPGIKFIKGQLEKGSGENPVVGGIPIANHVEHSIVSPGRNTQGDGYLHWQIIVHFDKKSTLSNLKRIFGETCHAEITRSKAAEEYVWKDDTSVGHRFELGSRALKRNSPKDWDDVRANAVSGNFSEIPSDIFIRCYSSLKRIHVDSLRPLPKEKQVFVFWGATGTGKSRRAWDEATFDAYPKEPTTKWWCGYSGQKSVVIDEFRGQIGISHLLRWFDRYPVTVETKGSACVLGVETFWITSNLSPDQWYPDLDAETLAALKRRFTEVIHFN
jgi:hypothetical protein